MIQLNKIGEKERFPPENFANDRFETKRWRIGNHNEVTTEDTPFPNSGSHKCAGIPYAHLEDERSRKDKI